MNARSLDLGRPLSLPSERRQHLEHSSSTIQSTDTITKAMTNAYKELYLLKDFSGRIPTSSLDNCSFVLQKDLDAKNNGVGGVLSLLLWF